MASTQEITNDTTRLLLMLWDMEGHKQTVKKGELTKRLLSVKKKTVYYKPIFEKLESSGAIAIKKNLVSLNEKGIQILGEELKNPDFIFPGAQIGAKIGNALLKWIRSSEPSQESQAKITDYEQFKQMVLEVHDRLNKEYNLKNLVPIYRLRRDIGDQVTRLQFNHWLIQMQSEDIFQLMAGEMPDITQDKREDSINIPDVGFRYYAQLLNSPT